MGKIIRQGWAKICNPFQPIDVIAVVVIIGASVLLFFKSDPIVSSILVMVVAYYFGKKTGVLPYDFQLRNNTAGSEIISNENITKPTERESGL